MQRRLTSYALLAAVAVLPVACAPQPAGMAAPAPVSSLSGPANAAPAAPAMASMPGMSGMDHSNMPGMAMQGMDHSNMQGMQGMDMNAMMARCGQVRQQAGAGRTAQGRQSLDQCDQMDRSMGMSPPARR